MAEKSYKSACGAKITEAHYWRNVARELLSKVPYETEKAQRSLSKKLDLSDEEKESRLRQAQEHVAKSAVYWSLISDCLDRSLAAMHPEEAVQFEMPHDTSLTPDKLAKKLVQDRLTVLSQVTSL